jgi:hypothetical protein
MSGDSGQNFPIASDGNDGTDHEQQMSNDNHAYAVERPLLSPDSKPRRSQKICMFLGHYQ